LHRPHSNGGSTLKFIKSSISDEHGFSWRNAKTLARQVVYFRIGLHVAYLTRENSIIHYIAEWTFGPTGHLVWRSVANNSNRPVIRAKLREHLHYFSIYAEQVFSLAPQSISTDFLNGRTFNGGSQRTAQRRQRLLIGSKLTCHPFAGVTLPPRPYIIQIQPEFIDKRLLSGTIRILLCHERFKQIK